MKNQTVIKYTRGEWLRALGLSALCGIVAIAVWFVVLLVSRGMSQAVSGAVRQGVWLLPTVIALFSPVLLIAGWRDASSLASGSRIHGSM